MSTPFRLLLVLGLVLSCGMSLAAREWQDKEGKVQVEADLIAIKNKQVYLEKKDGSIVKIPLEKLRKADMEYLLTLPKYKDYFAANTPPGIKPPKPGEVRIVKLKVEDESKVGEIRRFGDLGWAVKSLAFSPNAQFLAVGKMDRAIIVYDLNTSKRVSFQEKLEGLGSVTCLAFTPDGKKLLSGGNRGRIEIWNVDAKGRLTQAGRFVGHSREVTSITISRDGKFALSGSEEKKARYWKIEDGREQFVIDGFGGAVRATYLTPNGKQGLAADGKSLALIDVAAGKPIQSMALSRSSRSQCISIAPDGSKVMVAELYALRIWDIRTGKEYRKLQDREIQWSSTFSPDGKYVISGGSGKLNFWEVATQRKLYEFDVGGGRQYVQSLAFSADKRHVSAIPGSAGQAIQVFRLPASIAK